MVQPQGSRSSWGARLKRLWGSWAKSRLPRVAIQRVPLSPPCAVCGGPAAHVELVEDAEGWLLVFVGTAGNGTPPGGDRITAEKARALQDALTPPYEPATIRAAGFSDDFGYCSACESFYCATHWQVSPRGGGTCPEGHFKSLDPHWHPDWDEL